MIKTIIIIKRWGFFYFVNFYKAAAAYELETRKSSNLVRPGTVKYHDPVIIFALAVVDLLGPSLYTVIFVVAITEILIYARMTRAQTLGLVGESGSGKSTCPRHYGFGASPQ